MTTIPEAGRFPVTVSESFGSLVRDMGFEVPGFGDLDALRALATHLRAPLPERPHLILVEATDDRGRVDVLPAGSQRALQEGEVAIAAAVQRIPFIEETQSEPYISPSGEIMPSTAVRDAIGVTLLTRRRGRQQALMSRVGFGLVGVGAVGGVGGAFAHSHVAEDIGGGLFGLGTAIVAYAYNRSDPKLPNLEGVASPVAFPPRRYS